MMQYKVTHPDGYEQTIEAETAESIGSGDVVFLSENRTLLLTVDSRAIIKDADGNEVTPTASG